MPAGTLLIYRLGRAQPLPSSHDVDCTSDWPATCIAGGAVAGTIVRATLDLMGMDFLLVIEDAGGARASLLVSSLAPFAAATAVKDEGKRVASSSLMHLLRVMILSWQSSRSCLRLVGCHNSNWCSCMGIHWDTHWSMGSRYKSSLSINVSGMCSTYSLHTMHSEAQCEITSAIVLYSHRNGDAGCHTWWPQFLWGLVEWDLLELWSSGVQDLHPDPCPSSFLSGHSHCIFYFDRYVIGTGKKWVVRL